MKIYDISQEFTSSKVYPGDPSPSLTRLCSMENGSPYNLTAFSACAHNGTHVDAPSHFIKDGKSVAELDLSKTVGEALVIELSGEIGEKEAISLIKKAQEYGVEAAKRLLVKGDAVLMPDGAKILLKFGVELVGTESQSVGPVNAPMQVHQILLGGEVILLEGLRLDKVQEGVYFLFSAPINIGPSEGAPCRAILVDFEK